MPRFTSRIPDPRPSKAHPEHRKLRKELEKEHGYGWVPPVILALLGVTLAYDVTKDVEKHEQKHKQEEEEEEKRRRRRRERSQRSRRKGGDDEEDNGHDDDDDDDYDDDRDRRRSRRSRRRSEPQRWSVPDDIDVHNDYEGLGGGREPGMERAESLERGDVVDYYKLDGGLDRADQLEKGEGRGVDDDYHRDRYYEEDRPRRTTAYDEYDDQGKRYRRRRRRYEEEQPDYEYLDYTRGRRVLDERRSRPQPRRRSSDW